MRCDGCGFVRLAPPLREEEISYQEHYISPHYVQVQQLPVEKYERHFRDFCDAVNIDSVPKRRVLEIGSSHGLLMDLFIARGFQAEGIELQAMGVASARSRGLTVHAVPYEDFKPDQLFGLVLSTHVVEHIRDIGAYFRKTAEWLEPGGLNIILTPNGKSAPFWLLRSFWAGATPEEHNLFLTPESARILAEQHGFEVLKIKTTGYFWSASRGILAEFYHRWKAPPSSGAQPTGAASSPPQDHSLRDRIFRLLGWAEYPFLKLLHLLLNPFQRSDELLIVLRKKQP